MEYSDLCDNKATENEIRKFLKEGDMTAITIRIPKNPKDAAAEAAENSGMSFSAFIRMCMMAELAKRG